MDLPGDRQDVLVVEGLGFWVQAGGGFEVGEAELHAVDRVMPMAKYVEGTRSNFEGTMFRLAMMAYAG